MPLRPSGVPSCCFYLLRVARRTDGASGNGVSDGYGCPHACVFVFCLLAGASIGASIGYLGVPKGWSLYAGAKGPSCLHGCQVAVCCGFKGCRLPVSNYRAALGDSCGEGAV